MTKQRLRGLLLTAFGAILAAGCSFDPNLDNVGCGDDGLCPDGFRCDISSNTCVDLISLPTSCELDSECDDGSVCTDDSCENGSCVNAAIDCDDGVGCTVDTCDAVAGCSNTADDNLCDDGFGCTEQSCDAELDCIVVATDDFACNDSDACTADSCSETQGCEFTDTGLCAADNCCVAHGGTGCSNASLEAIVCGLDSFCCSTEWDDVCVDEAINFAGATCCGAGEQQALFPDVGPDGVNHVAVSFTSDPAACNNTFIDISGTGSVLLADADDEGAVATLGRPFDFYGTAFTDILVSSNGYLSVDLNDGGEFGGDFSNTCPMGNEVNGRISTYFDDLISNAVYHQYFTQCPRTHDFLPNQGCDIFMWDATHFLIGGSATHEAILYDQSSDVAVVYGPSFVNSGAASVGLRAATGTENLAFSCNTSEVAANEAVCFYDTDTCAATTCAAQLTHNASQVIDPAQGVACNDTATGLRRDNRFFRVFDLNDFGAGNYTVESIDVGVEEAVSGTGSPQNAVARIHTSTTNPPTIGSLTQLAEVPFTISDAQASSVINVPIFATVPAGSIMVVEWAFDDGAVAGHQLFPGANSAGETDVSYVSSQACTLPEIISYADIGFPGHALIINANGQADGPVCAGP